MRKASNGPTPMEVTYLRVLWHLGPSTARRVFEALVEEGEDTNYPAVLRMMQLMTEKGLLARNEEERSHVYRPAQERELTQGSLLEDLLERVFDGNTLEMLAATLSRRKMKPQEREEVTRLLAQADGKRKR